MSRPASRMWLRLARFKRIGSVSRMRRAHVYEDPATDVLEQVAHCCAEDLGLMVTEERGVSEHLQDDEAMQVSPRAQQESRCGGWQIPKAVVGQLFQVCAE
ncbi:MAG: hypothetical protein QOI21_3033 [Actinomycetota bacterium]|nr:hypothetical protein [Actinomycetota bacterium]